MKALTIWNSFHSFALVGFGIKEGYGTPSHDQISSRLVQDNKNRAISATALLSPFESPGASCKRNIKQKHQPTFHCMQHIPIFGCLNFQISASPGDLQLRVRGTNCTLGSRPVRMYIVCPWELLWICMEKEVWRCSDRFDWSIAQLLNLQSCFKYTSHGKRSFGKHLQSSWWSNTCLS